MEKRSRKEKNKKSKTKIYIITILLIIILAGVFLAFKITNGNQNNPQEVGNIEGNVKPQEIVKEEVQIFKGTDRPIAVMIDNHNGAWPQAGIQDAYMVYEIIVEGSETRLIALFKGQDTKNIGPVRSARHYFLDYAMENDATYAHFGQSPQAKSDLKKFDIDDINGIAEDGTTFWRVNTKSAPHNSITSIKNLVKSAENKKYKTKSTEKSILNYQTDEVNLENGKLIKSVTIPHSSLQKVKYVYDEGNKVFERYARNVAQKDLNTGKVITTKNIIITFADNYTLDDPENKGRQGLKNIGTFDGYYITNGRAIKIKCIKDSRSSKTKYQDLDGNEIKVNDGNTFVNICSTNTKVIFEELADETNVNNGV